MTEIEKILLLFSDNFFTAIAFNPLIEYVYEAIIIFGTMNPVLATLVAALGKFCGGLVNYLLGRMFFVLISEDNKTYLLGLEQYNKRLFFLPILACIPILGVFLLILAGLFRQKFIHFAFFLLLGYVGWFIYMGLL